jgi:hypothetical protein
MKLGLMLGIPQVKSGTTEKFGVLRMHGEMGLLQDFVTPVEKVVES